MMSEYQKRAMAQGVKWVQGVSEHNRIDDECCPDFSCCYPALFERDSGQRRMEMIHHCQRNGWPLPPELKGS